MRRKKFVTFELEFPLNGKPRELKLRQNVLHEIDYTENNPWESTYITGLRQEGGASVENLLLTSSNILSFTCDWTTPAPMPATTSSSSTTPTPSAAPRNDPPAALNKPLPPTREIPWAFLAGLGVVAVIVVLIRFLKNRRA